MPRISEFYGISIYVYYGDHNPPHYHAICGDREALIRIAGGSVIEGGLRSADERRVRDWHRLHADELAANWERARQGEELLPMAPLP